MFDFKFLKMKSTKRLWVTFLLGAVLTWALFRPDFQISESQIERSVLNEISRTGFKGTVGVSRATFKSNESDSRGFVDQFEHSQTLRAINASITEKRSIRKGNGLPTETLGLYAGPIKIVRYVRTPPPVIGHLLPGIFWASEQVTKFGIDQINDFPGKVGGAFNATYTLESRYAGGEFQGAAMFRLTCRVTEQADAKVVHTKLQGAAVKIVCQDALIGRSTQPELETRPTPILDESTYEHWYVLEKGWSIAASGKFKSEVAQLQYSGEWSSELVFFE